jgi:Na+/alanine symporter
MKWLKLLHGMVWGPWTLLILLGTGLFLTVKCRYLQSRGFSYLEGCHRQEALIRVKINMANTKRRQIEVPREALARYSL